MRQVFPPVPIVFGQAVLNGDYWVSYAPIDQQIGQLGGREPPSLSAEQVVAIATDKFGGGNVHADGDVAVAGATIAGQAGGVVENPQGVLMAGQRGAVAALVGDAVGVGAHLGEHAPHRAVHVHDHAQRVAVGLCADRDG